MKSNFLRILFNTNNNSLLLNRKNVLSLNSRQFVREIVQRLLTFKEIFDASLKKNEKSVNVDPLVVFANNELKLAEIDVYGFDYDYTLAIYKEALQVLIYRLGKEKLVDKLKYPRGIKDLPYKPGFAIRGLHYDMQKGILMKLDSFHQIQLTSVYRGLTHLTEEEVIDAYKGSHISQELIRGSSRQGPRMRQLNDLFSVPETCLLSSVNEYFIRNKIPHHPEILSHDVQGAVRRIHPTMHAMLEQANNIGEYLEKHEPLAIFLQGLQNAGKKMFLITNSPFKFVDCGMTYMLGPCWRNYFDIVIVEAKKPLFFANQSWPFRIYDEKANCTLWEEVKSLEKGRVYIEGNLNDLQRMTKWYGKNVLYVGDQIYSDLADLTLHHGWRTGAIIYELSHEINILNQSDYKKAVAWLKSFQSTSQELFSQDSEYIRKTYEDVRAWTKAQFNKQFGSIFRTHDNPTYFSRRLFRYSDIYTSEITNLSKYQLNHTFYPKRFALPHEK
ncbi:5'-nucleotidase domain-containing protein 3 [Trichonephila clavata]|uniref:5'-nucleotidase domain-containing protein 3 n=2 Tax=Trichonephila clavata TaxID=2740835 RepID=A0A8X6GKR6_TRICU|nr:5'-nucleotidase domain-containing protein 3 [Trichonephila clavata]